MVRRLKNAALDSRNARLKLEQSRKPRFVSVGQGLSLGYRRNKTAGTWAFRKADGSGGMNTKAIGIADDYVEADGESVLSYGQAVDKARELGRAARGAAPGSSRRRLTTISPPWKQRTHVARVPPRVASTSTSSRV